MAQVHSYKKVSLLSKFCNLSMVLRFICGESTRWPKFSVTETDVWLDWMKLGWYDWKLWLIPEPVNFGGSWSFFSMRNGKRKEISKEFVGNCKGRMEVRGAPRRKVSILHRDYVQKKEPLFLSLKQKRSVNSSHYSVIERNRFFTNNVHLKDLVCSTKNSDRWIEFQEFCHENRIQFGCADETLQSCVPEKWVLQQAYILVYCRHFFFFLPRRIGHYRWNLRVFNNQDHCSETSWNFYSILLAEKII